MPARCASTASRSPAGRRTRSRAWAPASCSSIRGRCTARPCWKTSSSRCLPDKLTRLFADPQTDERARAIAARVGLSAVLDRRPAHAAVRRSAQDRDRQGDRARSAGAADRRAVRRPDLEGNGGLLRSDLRTARRRPRRASGRSQRQKRRPPGRPRPRHVCRRAHRRRHRRRGDAQRNRAARLSRRQHRDRGAAGILVPRRRHAVPRSRQCQRPIRQGAGAAERLDPRPCRRIRLGRRPQRRRQNHAVQCHFRPAALCRRHPPRRRVAARPLARRRSRAAASCNARKAANCSPT